jgi:dethiobiotin synthetase
MAESTHAVPGGRGLFVAGTDTGVGKTRVACLLLRGYAARGERVLGMKPVAAGARASRAGLRNEDVELLRAASNVEARREHVNPYCFAPAIGPHIAAAEAGTSIHLETIVRAYAALERLADRVIVEGAGGFMVPLGPQLNFCDVTRALALPIVLVVGMRLGCLSHALLTRDAIVNHGLVLAGWVANCIEPRMARLQDNVQALRQRMAAPLLDVVPYDPGRRQARILDLSELDSRAGTFDMRYGAG